MDIGKKCPDRCTVVVSSCDRYADLWDPFFKILSQQWPDIGYPVVLLTEKAPYTCAYMDIDVFHTGDMPWGKMLRKCLQAIDTEYVMLLLEDFFPLERVDQGRIEQCLDWMDQDRDIAVFSFFRGPGDNIRDNRYPHFERRPQEGEYRFNCQPAVWRRERLIEFIRPHESPWAWELLGSKRSARYPDKFYSAIEGEPYVFTHDFIKYGLRRGKWYKDTVELFRQYGIDMDFTLRGFYDKEEIHREKKRRAEQEQGGGLLYAVGKRIRWWRQKAKGRITRYKSLR